MEYLRYGLTFPQIIPVIGFPSNIRPCLFRIMPMDQFAAQAEYDEKQLELLSVDDDKPNDEHRKHYLESLAESAEKEKKMNKLASTRRIEDISRRIWRHGSAPAFKNREIRKH